MIGKKLLLFPRLKLAYIVFLVLLSLPTYSPTVSAQFTNSANKPFFGTPINSTRPNFPDNGIPTGRRKGGTSRDACSVLSMPVTAIVPGEETLSSAQKGTLPQTISSKSFLALTVSEYPIFWFYIPNLPPNLHSAEFVLLNEIEDDIYRSRLTLPEKPGVISISLPQQPKYSLDVDKKYHWYLKVYCNDLRKTSGYFYIDGLVQRVALTQKLESQLKAVKPREYIAYIDNGIWYDAITNLASLRSSNLQNDTLQKDWANLLKSVGLQDIAEEPIVRYYKAEE
ncbi:MAG: DUF928 domain-containing protein [Nostoc sp. ChiSLP02]|nr:DUF928 domain-containing protein [Nostoc sp. DedSLP05]MDZ8100999.1 DUF928 domain-containing protein [Nostoc sp. DedSLP01]MDZ8188453.1 DUF928 domain-containing protein [Nostoc sp. ChiSLP02]